MKQVFSKYFISWIVLLPTKGKSTKRDVDLLNKQNPLGGYGIVGADKYMIARHFPSKQKAISELKRLKGLGKPYKGYVITDAQFGNMKIDFVKGKNQLFITNKQKSESKIVK